MPYEGNPDAPTGPTQPGAGLSSSWYPLSAVQASGTNYNWNYAPNTGQYIGNQSATPAAAPAAPGGGIGPDITLGPDGNFYGYSRQYDQASNSYTYAYKSLGPASDLNAVSTASGIPVGMLQAVYQQQQVTLNNLAAQGQINPYAVGGMTQQQLSQALDQVRMAQQYNAASGMQQIDPTTGVSYAQMQNAYDQRNATFQYQNQGQAQQATQYGYQRANDQGQNYNTQSGINGMTYGQLDTTNNNMQAQQQYAYGQNAAAQNPYSGMTNAQTGLVASNASNAYSLGENQYNLGTAAYTGGQTRQQYSQGTQDLQNQYNRANSTYQLGHQANQQALDTYHEMSQGMQAQKLGQSRNLAGVGWAGITRPSIAGTQ